MQLPSGLFWTTILNMDWDILGHTWAVALLKSHILQGQVRHAYLITGPRGVGRRTLALRLAQALNCPTPAAPGEPCLACLVCRQIEQMQFADLSVVQAEKVGGTLKIEQVRALQHELALTPYQAKRRIALLLRFEEAHNSAANALLKTLEEPPGDAILLVTAESLESLPPTIVSRCEVLRLRPLPLELAQRGLEERWKLEPAQAELLAHLSGGRLGVALQYVRDENRLPQRQAWLEGLWELLGADRAARFAKAEAMAKDKSVLQENLLVWAAFWRDVQLCTLGAKVPLVNLDWREQVEWTAKRLNPRQAAAVLTAAQRTLDDLTRNVNARLAVEVLMLDMPYLSKPN